MPADSLSVSVGCVIGSILLTSLFCTLYLEGLGVMLHGPQARDACPRCRRGAIERVTASSGGDRFYRCNRCWARYKRSSRAGPLQVASSPVYDGAFLRGTSRGACEKPALPVDEETYWTRTIDSLVRSKRSRGHRGGKQQEPGDRNDPHYLSCLWDSEYDSRA